MTAQMPEILLHRGMRLSMAACPLEDYLKRIPKKRRPDLVWTSTACWRGYIGTWEILDSCLYLIGMHAHIKVGEQVVQADLDVVLPWVKGCLRATWVNDLVRCPEGRLVEYAHNYFGSTYERERLLAIRKGRVESEFISVTPPPPILYRVDASGQRQCVVDFRDEEGIADPLEGRPLSDAHIVWGQQPPVDPEDAHEYVIAAQFRRNV